MVLFFFFSPIFPHGISLCFFRCFHVKLDAFLPGLIPAMITGSPLPLFFANNHRVGSPFPAPPPFTGQLACSPAGLATPLTKEAPSPSQNFPPPWWGSLFFAPPFVKHDFFFFLKIRQTGPPSNIRVKLLSLSPFIPPNLLMPFFLFRGCMPCPCHPWVCCLTITPPTSSPSCPGWAIGRSPFIFLRLVCFFPSFWEGLPPPVPAQTTPPLSLQTQPNHFFFPLARQFLGLGLLPPNISLCQATIAPTLFIKVHLWGGGFVCLWYFPVLFLIGSIPILLYELDPHQYTLLFPRGLS